MIQLRTYIAAFLIITMTLACKQGSDSQEGQADSLKSSYQDDFYIGAALSLDQITGVDSMAQALVLREFNTITPENIMKWMFIHPEADRFHFEDADKFVTLGEENDMKVIAHTLVWHSQLAPWVNEIKDSTAMASMLINHISRIVGRYKGRVDGWDVVNEALNEDGTLRESVFYKMFGPNYIARAFAMASETDPKAELYYNDYNLCLEAKRTGCLALIKSIQDQGIKIDGVGIQAHWSLNGPSIEEIEKSILAYADLGIKVMFTELDITVLPNPWDLKGAEVSQNYEGSPFMNPYPSSLPDSVDLKLANRYEEIFTLFLKHKDKIDRVTFWGVNDGHSWLNNWPIQGRTNYPLLFDLDFKPKTAYKRIIDLKKDHANN